MRRVSVVGVRRHRASASGVDDDQEQDGSNGSFIKSHCDLRHRIAAVRGFPLWADLGQPSSPNSALPTTFNASVSSVPSKIESTRASTK